MIKHRTFVWGHTIDRIRSNKNVLSGQVKTFINKIGENKIVSIAGRWVCNDTSCKMNAMTVWYKE